MHQAHRPYTTEQPQRTTISDVARALGLTKGTVSRALNGYSDISASTRLRVQKKAEEMGYRPLSHAQAIRTGQVRSLGLVLQTSEPDGQRPFLADFLAGVTRAASAENWTLTVATSTCPDDTLSTLSRLVDERKADGFILPRVQVEDARIALLRGAGVPFVLYGRSADAEGCAWYDILGEEAMRDAVLRLAGQGHRRIAFVNGGAALNYGRLRLQGYLDGLAAAGLAPDAALIGLAATTPEQGAEAARQLLALDTPPTAILYAVDMAALGLYRVAAQTGLRIGHDISVIGYDGVPEGEFAHPPLTSFSVDSRRAGERLAALLIQRIRGAAPEALRETDNARLVARGSDGPPSCTPAELAAKYAAE